MKAMAFRACAAVMAAVAFLLTSGVAEAVAQNLTLHPMASIGGLVLATGAVATDRSIKQMRTDLKKLYAELEAGQKEMQDGPLSQARGEELDAKAEECEALQAEVDRFDRREKVAAKGREIRDPVTPTDDQPSGDEVKGNPRQTAGYVSLGEYVVAQKEFHALARTGFKGSVGVDIAAAIHPSQLVRTKSGDMMLALDRQQRKQFEDLLRDLEGKAVPTIGSGVIEPQRLSAMPQVTADDQLRLRDVMNIGQTGQTGSVSYLREESFTRAAAPTTPGNAKPEATVQYTEQTAAVATIPVWMPVLTTQLADFPQLRSLIDGRLLYDLRKAEEEQLIWGDGNAPNLEGLAVVSGTTDIAANGRYVGSTHTLIDVVRMGITDVRVAGYEPNAALLHPYDWEDIVLEKGTDNRYVWVVVTDESGSRLWGVRVVETVAMEENAGNATEERNLIVGDFRRGAQLLDRMQSTVMVGLNSDDFTKNKRTILAEERVAFPIYAPAAFAKFETQALATA